MKHFRVLLLIWIALTAFPAFGANPGPIVLNSPASSLEQVLGLVSEKSGVQFQVSGSLGSAIIQSKATGPDWDAVIHQLLAGFNVVEVRNGQGDLKKVFVLSRKEDFVESETAETVSPALKKRPLQVAHIWLDNEKLKELAKGPFRKPLPAHFLKDHEMREFMVLQGVVSPPDLKDIQKAMRVRVEARRQLKLIRKEKIIFEQNKGVENSR